MNAKTTSDQQCVASSTRNLTAVQKKKQTKCAVETQLPTSVSCQLKRRRFSAVVRWHNRKSNLRPRGDRYVRLMVGHCCATTVCKLFTCLCSCHQAVNWYQWKKTGS